MILPGINLYNKASGSSGACCYYAQTLDSSGACRYYAQTLGSSGACRYYAQTLGSNGLVISRHYAVMILPEMSRETHIDIPDP